MRSLRLGFLSPLAVVVTLTALAAVAAISMVRGGGLFSPGDLVARAGEPIDGVRSHAELDTCASCHPAPWSGEVVSDRCIACHTAISAEVMSGKPLHGLLPEPAECLVCHTDHRGRDGRVTLLERVPHGSFGFALFAHEQHADGGPFTCADCHGDSVATLATQTCADCHDRLEPGFAATHETSWGPTCLACHDGVDRFSPAYFSHVLTGFPLTGRHQQLECTSCHADVRSLTEFAGVPRECVGCHPEPEQHRGRFGTACGECHSTDTWEGARFAHTFPLSHGRRGDSPCATCHQQAPRYDTYTCYGCHEHSPANIARKHRKEGIREFADCVRCHPTGREHEGGHD